MAQPTSNEEGTERLRVYISKEKLDKFLKISTYLNRSVDEHREFFTIFSSPADCEADRWEVSLGWGEHLGQINVQLCFNGINCFSDCHLQTDRKYPNTLRIVMFFEAALRNPKDEFEEDDLSVMGQIMLICLEMFWTCKNVRDNAYNFERLGMPNKVLSLHRELVVDLSNGEKIHSYNAKKRPRECLQDLYKAMGFKRQDRFNFFYHF